MPIFEKNIECEFVVFLFVTLGIFFNIWWGILIKNDYPHGVL